MTRRERTATTPERPAPLREALDACIARRGLEKRFDLANAIEAWPEAVGPQIAAVTQALGVTQDGVLTVRVATHGWATELGLMTPRILARLNGSKAGRIRHVRWFVGPLNER